MIKTLIVSGGRGTRLHSMTGSIVPKALCRISPKLHRPLIAYQLDTLQHSGFKDVMVVFAAKWHIEVFKQSIRAGEVPALNYSYELLDPDCKYPATILAKRRVRGFIGKNDLFWTYGDIVCSRDMLIGMKTVLERNNTSVIATKYLQCQSGESCATLALRADGVIVGVSKTSGKYLWGSTPLLIQGSAIKLLFSELRKTHFKSSSPFLSVLLAQGKLSSFCPRSVINVNTPEALEDAKNTLLSLGA